VVEHRAVDREQDDVARGHIERHAVQALGAHRERGDDPVDVVAAVPERPVDRQVAAVVGVEHEAGADRGQHPPDRPPGRLQHEQRDQRTGDHVERRGREGAPDEVVEDEQRVEAGGERDRGEQPVDDAGVVRRAGFAAGAAGAGAVAQEGERQHHREEGHPVRQHRAGVERPVQDVHRQGHADDRDEEGGAAGQPPRRSLGVELRDQALDGGAPRRARLAARRVFLGGSHGHYAVSLRKRPYGRYDDLSPSFVIFR